MTVASGFAVSAGWVPEVVVVLSVVSEVFDEDVAQADKTSINRSRNEPMIDLEIEIRENERVSVVETFLV